jgi:hypothetical protein
MEGDGSPLIAFARAIASGDQAGASSIAGEPGLALARLTGGEESYLGEIEHQVYAGDTALHIAAATYNAVIARELVGAGAITMAVNRRGAVALHYAVDGSPGSARWNPAAQRETVLCLVELGADPNAVDKNATDAPPPSRHCWRSAQIPAPPTEAGPRPSSSPAGRPAAEEAALLRRGRNRQRSSGSCSWANRRGGRCLRAASGEPLRGASGRLAHA